MKEEYKPYCYLIGWSNLNIWYYGCQYRNTKGRIATPNNLWTKYFTSSKVVKEFRKEYGEPDVIEIRKVFKNREDTMQWEEKVLQRLNASHNEKWLNKHNGGKGFVCVNVSDKVRKIRSDNIKGDKNPNYKKIWSQEERAKQSERMIGKYVGNKNPMYGKERTDDVKEKLRKANINSGFTYVQYDMNGVIIKKGCIGLFLEEGFTSSAISRVSSGERKSTKGFSFKKEIENKNN
jgi:hypothetical protein